MLYDIERDHIEMSVKELCEMALLSGNIDCHRPHVDLFERAAEGQKIHRQLQTSFGAHYHSEVELRNTSKLDEVYFYVKGRADGILYHNGHYTIDEIKTVGEKVFSSHQVDRLHLAQLYCYAYFLCRTKDLYGLITRMIYYNVDSGEIEYHEKYLTSEELRAFYLKLLSAMVVAVFLTVPYWKGRYFTKVAAKGGAKNA